MPKGIPNNSLRAGGLGPSENTQRLIEAMQGLKARLAAEKRKDTSRALLLQFASKHNLTALDLRAAARVLADRKVSGQPVYSKNSARVSSGRPGLIKASLLKPAKGKIGKAIRKARLKLNMSGKAVADQIGCSGSMIGKIEMGINHVPARMMEKMTEVLKLPKGTFPPQPKANGHAEAQP